MSAAPFIGCADWARAHQHSVSNNAENSPTRIVGRQFSPGSYDGGDTPVAAMIAPLARIRSNYTG
jgi:hypothetical protein